jgi:hypothetical protein
MSLASVCSARSLRRVAYATALLSIMSISSAISAPSADAEAAAQENWRNSILETSVSGSGCFMAEYPSTSWMPVGCSKPSRVPYPRTSAGSATVGNGNDYAIEAANKGFIRRTIGSFPTVTGVTSETDPGNSNAANDYTLQLNTNFMNNNDPACEGVKGCLAWQQFIYSSGEQQVFMQYWLIGFGDKCPAGGPAGTGWIQDSGSCFGNSNAVTAPQYPITDLDTFKLQGVAAIHSNDTVTFVQGTTALSVTGADTIVNLASGWHESEFNIVGDGGGSEAKFNTGSSVRVKIAIGTGDLDTPLCLSESGTTAETNNLNLKACGKSASGATYPYVLFYETN